MPRVPKQATKAAERLARYVKANVEKRLHNLGVTAYTAAKLSGHHVTWLSDALRRDTMTLAWLADAAEALGLPPISLLLPPREFSPSKHSPPKWAQSMKKAE